MQERNRGLWMWEEALALLSRAERLQQRFFEVSTAAGPTCWEPPIDLFERDGDLALIVALPGVAPERTEIQVEADAIVVRGTRVLALPQRGNILRLEIPYGPFERRIPLPPGTFRLLTRDMEHGCLRLVLQRLI